MARRRRWRLPHPVLRPTRSAARTRGRLQPVRHGRICAERITNGDLADHIGPHAPDASASLPCLKRKIRSGGNADGPGTRSSFDHARPRERGHLRVRDGGKSERPEPVSPAVDLVPLTESAKRPRPPESTQQTARHPTPPSRPQLGGFSRCNRPSLTAAGFSRCSRPSLTGTGSGRSSRCCSPA